jgi:hypothetical protein
MAVCEGPHLRQAHNSTEKLMKDILTKLGIMTGLLGAIAFGATDTALAKPRHVARSVEKVPYNYTCQSSWFYPGYYCYEDRSYDRYPSYHAYNRSLYAYGSDAYNSYAMQPGPGARRSLGETPALPFTQDPESPRG